MHHRLQILQEKLRENDFGAAILWYSRDVFYYTGTAQPSYLAVLPNAFRLFVRGGLPRALEEVFIDPDLVEEQKRLEPVMDYLRRQGLEHGAWVGTQLEMLPVSWWRQWKELAPGWEFENISPLILDQRQVKEALEVEAIARACQAVHAGHLRVLEVMREGVSELELAAEVESAQRRAGHEGYIFLRLPDFFMSRGPLASGPNLLRNSGVVLTLSGAGLGPALPVGPSRRRIRRGDAVLIDIPTMVGGYHADQSRMYVLGRATGLQKKLQEGLSALFERAWEVMRPGRTWSQAYHEVLEAASKLGIDGILQNLGHGRKAHYLGHGIGLEVNEPPMITATNHHPIRPGTVVALEMHFLVDGETALKMEDVLLIGEKDNRFLTLTPRRLFEIG